MMQCFQTVRILSTSNWKPSDTENIRYWPNLIHDLLRGWTTNFTWRSCQRLQSTFLYVINGIKVAKLLKADVFREIEVLTGRFCFTYLLHFVLIQIVRRIFVLPNLLQCQPRVYNNSERLLSVYLQIHIGFGAVIPTSPLFENILDPRPRVHR